MELKELEDQLEGIVDKLTDNSEDFIYRRISHVGFAKIIFFIGVKARKDEFVVPREIAEFRKISQQRVYYILQDLCRAGILRKDCKTETMAVYWIKRDGFGVPIVNKYMNIACKTLGIKEKIVLEEGDKSGQ